MRRGGGEEGGGGGGDDDDDDVGDDDDDDDEDAYISTWPMPVIKPLACHALNCEHQRKQ